MTVLRAFDEYERATRPPPEGRAGRLQAAMRTLGECKPALENNYLAKGLLDRDTFSVMYGAANSGKTFIGLELALHVAAGMSWRGLRINGGPVLYIALEGGRGIHNRIAALQIENPALIEGADRDKRFRLLSLPLDLHAGGDTWALIDALPVLPALIVVDTLARAMGAGDENGAADMGQFIANVDRLRGATGAHVMAMHHSGKDATKGARGSSALRAAADTEIEVRQEHGVITVEDKKQRDLPCDFIRTFALKPVVIGEDEDGDEVGSAVLMVSEAVSAKPKLTGSQEVALQALNDTLAEYGERIASDDYPARPVVKAQHWRDMCDRHGLTETDSPDAKRKAFGRAKDALLDKHLIREFDGRVWRVQP